MICYWAKLLLSPGSKSVFYINIYTKKFAKKDIRMLGSHALGIFLILVNTPTYGMIKSLIYKMVENVCLTESKRSIYTEMATYFQRIIQTPNIQYF